MAKYRPKRHQQPSWSMKGGGFINMPIEITHWEKFLLAENIAEEDLGNNPKVAKFIQKYLDKFFIPTKVLKMYNADYDL